VSASIDSDAYFELMMSNTWNIESANNPASMPYAGSRAKISTVNSRDAYRRDHHRNLFGTDKETPFESRAKGAQWQTSNAGSYAYQGDGTTMQSAGGGKNVTNNTNPNMAWLTETQRESGVDYRGIQKNDDELTTAFRQKLASRGARGLLGMQRVFKIMDDNNSGTLDIQEFWKAICDFRVPVSPEECRQMFDLFDSDDSGEVSYDELMRAVAGEMNPIRKSFVGKAFKKIDVDGSGELDKSDIKSCYNAKAHPDVKKGIKTEDEVLAEFLDTFEVHHGLKHPEDRDGKVTLREFIEYYNNISSTIDNDEYFELMITNAWNLNNVNYAKGWGGEV
jgi:Ca2+-binding EF-hand superfamily protein